MNDRASVAIGQLATGVPGLDTVLGGGLPEYSFNLIAGAPGTGKTTLTHQIMFTNGGPDRRVLHFTVLGEPPLKMLRYQQQFTFFDSAKLLSSIRFVNLSEQALTRDLSTVLDAIVREVREFDPAIVVVDSFRTVVRSMNEGEATGLGFQEFLQRLALQLTSWQATTFLVGEYAESDIRDNPVFTVADGILWLSQSVDRNSIVRKLQVVKLRGQAPMPGLHTMRISENGIQVFPRIIPRTSGPQPPPDPMRMATGVAGLDEMLGGGIPAGDSALVAGPSGSGKTVLATQFVAEGVRIGEPGVMVIFEEHPSRIIARSKTLGVDFDELVAAGLLEVIYLRPLDLSVDEALLEIQSAIERIGAKRLAIDSLSGFEIALAPTFREDFRESLYRLVGALTNAGVTVFMTVEIVESFGEMRFSPNLVSFLTDDLILQRYVELNGELRKVLTVVKMRGSEHSRAFHAYEVGAQGLIMGEALTAYEGIVTGAARLRRASPPVPDPPPDVDHA